MALTQKTRVTHAFVVRGTLGASDDLIEFVDEHDEADLVYRRHSMDKLFVSESRECECKHEETEG